MRLIDKDFILETAKDKEWGLWCEIVNIKFAPEVDAIPVEWIKKWCLEHYPTYPRIVTEELLKKTETWRMIEDWEKENELDKVQ